MFNKINMILVSGIFLFGLLVGCSYSSSEEGQNSNTNPSAQEDTSKATTEAVKTEPVVENKDKVADAVTTGAETKNNPASTTTEKENVE